jgi:hypothetical protein
MPGFIITIVVKIIFKYSLANTTPMHILYIQHTYLDYITKDHITNNNFSPKCIMYAILIHHIYHVRTSWVMMGYMPLRLSSTAGRRMRSGGGPVCLAGLPLPLSMCRPCITLSLDHKNIQNIPCTYNTTTNFMNFNESIIFYYSNP